MLQTKYFLAKFEFTFRKATEVFAIFKSRSAYLGKLKQKFTLHQVVNRNGREDVAIIDCFPPEILVDVYCSLGKSKLTRWKIHLSKRKTTNKRSRSRSQVVT